MPTHRRRGYTRTSDGAQVSPTTVHTRGGQGGRASATLVDRLRGQADAGATPKGRKGSYVKKTPEERRAEIDALGSQLEAGVESLVSSDDWKRYLNVQSRFPRYSPNNTMLILMQNPEATRVAGYRTWRGMDRQVRKGEKGITILAPARYTRVVEDEATGEERRVSYLRGFTTVKVFDVSQTDGEPLPEVAHLLKGEAPEGLREDLDGLITARGYTVETVPRAAIGGANGCCNYATRTVSIADDLEPAQGTKTRVHELAHAILHESASGGICNDSPRSRKEVEAESTAYVVCNSLGMDTSGYTFGYVAGWSRGDSKSVRESMEHVARAAKEILGGLAGDSDREEDAA